MLLWSVWEVAFVLVASSAVAVAVMALERLSWRRLKSNDDFVREVRVGFLGNSIQYFNDLPRVLEAMLVSQRIRLRHVCCFRGGASLKSLAEKGNGVRGEMGASAKTIAEVFESGPLDFCVLNDFTQAPARLASRAVGLETLLRSYAPLVAKNGCVPIFLSTYSYRKHAKHSEDIGSIPDDFTKKLDDGYEAYALALTAALPNKKQRPRVARVGAAFKTVHDERPDIWHNLFFDDDFHPSPLGTYLQACVLYCVITGKAPPTFPTSKGDVIKLWQHARYMQPPSAKGAPCRLPTPNECSYLRDVATRVVLDQRSRGAAALAPTAWQTML